MTARLLIPGLLALMLPPAAVRSAQDDSPYGTYSYVKGMRGDQPVPEEDLKTYSVKIDETKLSLLGPEGTPTFEISYVIDEDKGDGTYTASLTIIKSEMQETVGSKAKALSRHEGDTITLIYDFAEDADYPADFEPKGPTQQLFVLKKKPATPGATAPQPARSPQPARAIQPN
jgi:hypothetical protein